MGTIQGATIQAIAIAIAMSVGGGLGGFIAMVGLKEGKVKW